jgi:DNA helicase-2/ATP-dependent DNA helicase PcrA
MMDEIRAQVAGLPVKTLLERILARTGYSAALAQEDSQESQSRLENLAELLSAAADHDVRSDGAGLSPFLDQVSLLSDVDQARGEAPVVLLTLQSAKGLEFHSVFLVGMEEGLVPHARSLVHPDSLEEERRLCYVGMTRAMDRLHLTYVQSRQVFGQRRLAEPSRFLSEIPRERVKTTGEGDSSFRSETLFAASRATTPPARVDAAPSSSELAELRPGVRVRHPLFGVGTVLRCDGGGPDLKVTVSFAGVGAKRLVARFAGLEIL